LAAALLLALGSAAAAQGLADRLWSDVAEAAIASTAERQIVPAAYRTVRMDRAAMAEVLAAAPRETRPFDTREGAELPLPTPEGGFITFRLVEAPVMAPALQARYPEIRSYYGQSVDAPGRMVRISATPDGFRALVLGAGGTMLIDPFQPGDAEHYSVYYKRDYAPEPARLREAFENETVLDALGAAPLDPEAPLPENGELLRTYRLALAATGEYSQRILTLTGNDPDVSDTLEVLAAQVVAMTRVNGIYERDLSVRMELVEDNDEIIYLDGDTDPYSNSSPFSLLRENQSNLDAVIGSANYDVGHVFSTGGGGLAELRSVCVNGSKARGETGLTTPIGDVFYVDYVAHEFGHQFGANHTFNGSAGQCSGFNRNGSTAYEPGSGSTIMAYADICSDHNIQTFSDDYFHTISLQEIVSFISVGPGSTCPQETETGNEPPVVEAAGVDGLVLPVETPFVLTGSATDDGGTEPLTYVWEEFDLGPAGAPPGQVGWPEAPPFFRSFLPTPEPVRTLPRLDLLLEKVSSDVLRRGEGLPLAARTLNFRLTVRDNLGGIADEQVQLSVTEEAGPFRVTFANTDSLVFGAIETVVITWDVAGTDANGVDAGLVDILFSADNGETFVALAESTPNDGAEEVAFPGIETGEDYTGRILIRAVDHIFFDVNDEPFALSFDVANEARPEATHALSAVYPNPFGLGSVRATLALTVSESQAVRAVVYDALGRQVAVLHEGPIAAGQNRQLALDATTLAGGTYFVRVVGETFTDVRQVTVVR
jgi:hypothetical protein